MAYQFNRRTRCIETEDGRAFLEVTPEVERILRDLAGCTWRSDVTLAVSMFEDRLRHHTAARLRHALTDLGQARASIVRYLDQHRAESKP